jgi:hypothetical protein
LGIHIEIGLAKEKGKAGGRVWKGITNKNKESK